MPCGSVRMMSYPLAADTKASAIPVLPLVASTMVVRPGSIRPSASAASIIATPMRSLTDPPGLNISSFPNTRPAGSPNIRLSWTMGVRPPCSAMLTGMRPMGPAYPPVRAAIRSGYERAEAGDRGLRAGLALDRDGLGGADVLARVRGDLLRLPAEPVRAVQDGAVAVVTLDHEARHALTLLERLHDVRDVLRVLIGRI